MTTQDISSKAPDFKDVIELVRGFEVDEDEAWKKVISRQFAGSPARAVGELIVNSLDSYPAHTPWQERPISIESGPNELSISDWGEGMGLERLKLLLTLGGSDKRADDSKIGRFGIGFYAIFNPSLRARRVTVTTRCEGRIVTLRLEPAEPGARPRIDLSTSTGDFDFSTRIVVEFDDPRSVNACLAAARQRFEFYPCPVTIDGRAHESVWDRVRREGRSLFERGEVRGYLQESPRVSILSKYQFVMSLSVPGLITGGHDQTHDLRDYRRTEVPYVPHTGAVVECGDLQLTIARDSFYLDAAYQRMIAALKDALMRRLAELLRDPRLHPAERSQIVLANQFALGSTLVEHMRRRVSGAAPLAHSEVYDELADAPIYRLNGRTAAVSLQDLLRLKSKNLPLFFAPRQSNLRWLGGAFKHDFVVLPPECTLAGGAPEFHQTIFSELFPDFVNLDTVRKDRERIAQLVERGIVPRDALGARLTVLDRLDVGESERALLDELNAVLASGAVKSAVRNNLALRVGRLTAGYFRVHDDSVAVSAGLFDGSGQLLEKLPKVPIARDLTLGLRLDHPLVGRLAASSDPHRAYYALTFLSHELAHCQELLVPDTPAFYFVKNALAADMRTGLVKQLLEARAAG